MHRVATLGAAWLLFAAAAHAGEAVRLANNPSLSPDGSELAFDWNGDVWSVPSNGGKARQLTQHAAKDRQPKYSPDGREIAFVSERDGSPQVYVMPAAGGTPTRLTRHTTGFGLEGWSPDGQKLLVSVARDHHWRNNGRFFLVDRRGKGEEQLFDDYGGSGQLSPDGKRLLFGREGAQWWRKGYRGSQAGQVWQYDLAAKSFAKLLSPPAGAVSPLWRPDGQAVYYCGGQTGAFNLYELDLGSKQERALTRFPDDSVVQPCVSRDGSAVVFRHLFDLYKLDPRTTAPPKKLDITLDADRVPERTERKVLTTVSAAAFSNDGLDIAFIAGGDVWVMDTELREPKQITDTPEEEKSPAFSPDGNNILFVSERGGKSDVLRAERGDAGKYWWLNESFKVTPVTTDGAAKSSLKFSPDGSHVAHVRGRGDLWTMRPNGTEAKLVVAGFTAPQFDWSPDGKYLAVARDDADFNRDVWIVPHAGGEPYNVSRHPFNDTEPAWSPDGKILAFTGRKSGTDEVDISYVYLRAEDDEQNTRERTLEKALEKVKKARRTGPRTAEGADDKKDDDVAKAEQRPAPGRKGDVVIDFEGLHQRVRRINNPDSAETNLVWSPDGKKLAFSARGPAGTGDEPEAERATRGTFTVEFPDELKPKQLSPAAGSNPRWLKNGSIVWVVNGVPGSISGGGSSPTPGTSPLAAALAARVGRTPAPTPPAAASPATPTDGTSYRFQALQTIDVPRKNAAVFELAWRTMRDNYYDEALNRRDWDAVRSKYLDAAAGAPDADALAAVINLMLGELNGSHLGFYPGGISRRGPALPEEPTGKWRETTGHLGVRFDPAHAGPGVKVRDVLPTGPADQKKSRIEAGEIVLRVNGREVNSPADAADALTAPPGRDAVVQVRAADGKTRDVTVRPTTYTRARELLYEKWLRDNRKAVEAASNNSLGYLHVSAMNMESFYKFEADLYAAGAGKDGLVIDVRENGGGSTADHLLTALTQPVHAVAVPRGGGPGYPQDRKVYATWNKPIIVLCNQNSFSNAEIFSHAIKTLKRGKLVGVTTAGGVISTGAASIMDAGTLRLPFRGWYLANDGQDMELNGAVPDLEVWPQPGDLARGKDAQLETAVAALKADVEAWKNRPQSKLIKAVERK